MDIKDSWRIRHEQARNLPAMFIGDQRASHRLAVSQTVELVSKTKAFSNYRSTTVWLSPTKYVVQCLGGTLVHSVEESFSWGNKYLIMEDWQKTLGKLRKQYIKSQQHLDDWRHYFGSPTGPALDTPIYPAILSEHFAVAYSTSEGYWCQEFSNGFPDEKSFLITQSSSISLAVIATLSPRWFLGLPYTEEYVKILNSVSHINAQWYPNDEQLNWSIRDILESQTV